MSGGASEVLCQGPLRAGPLALALLNMLLPHAQGASLSDVPGKVIDWQAYAYVDNFFSDDAIVVLTNGDYVAAHAWHNSTSDTSGTTRIFRSSDKGETWAQLTTLNGILRGSLFAHDGALFILGATTDVSGNQAVIRKSLDHGSTWTSATTGDNGLFTYGGMATPNRPVEFSNRVWSATTTSSFSAPAVSNLLYQGSWKIPGGFPAAEADWLSAGAFIGEGQIVASPGTGVAVLPKVKGTPHTALTRVNPVSGAVTFDPDHDFVELPGGEKKFGAAYDAGSGRFFVLSNPVLPAHAGSGLAPDMIRNTAAVLSSHDLYNWKVEKLFLYSTDIDHEGFGYLNFDFDGTSMVVVARTAYTVPGITSAARGHDSNMLTFHRLDGFRNLRPDHVLVLGGGTVKRYEKTHPRSEDAPLGTFALGATFAGAALTNPNGMGTTNGAVFIREAAGRILRFDLAGNFIEATNAAPAAFQTGPLAIGQPCAGECSWVKPSSGTWADPLNWHYWNRPDVAGDVAVFGSAAPAACTVTVASSSGEWLFDTDGDAEGWTSTAVFDPLVVTGVCQGTATNSGPSIKLTLPTGQGWTGARFSEARVRLRMPGQTSAAVDFYWATQANNTFAEARKARQTYTGNGAFQELVFPLSSHAQWNGQVIRQFRVDPFNAATTGQLFQIDSVRIVRESFRLSGLRFRSAQPYTLAGAGPLRIEPAGGTNAALEVQAGSHTCSVPLLLSGQAEAALAQGASLRLSCEVSGGASLIKTGAGTLALDGAASFGGAAVVCGGTLALGASGTLAVGTGIAVSNSAVFDVSAPAGGYTLASGRRLEGDGSVTGLLTVATAASLSAGAADAVGTLTVRGGLTLSDGSLLDWTYDPAANTSDVIRVEGALTLPAQATVTLVGAGGLPDARALFTAAAIQGDADLRDWTLVNAPSTMRAVVKGNRVVLICAGLVFHVL